MVKFASNQFFVIWNLKRLRSWTKLRNIPITISHFEKYFIVRLKVDSAYVLFIFKDDTLNSVDFLWLIKDVTVLEVWGSSLALMTIRKGEAKCWKKAIPQNLCDEEISKLLQTFFEISGMFVTLTVSLTLVTAFFPINLLLFIIDLSTIYFAATCKAMNADILIASISEAVS